MNTRIAVLAAAFAASALPLAALAQTAAPAPPGAAAPDDRRAHFQKMRADLRAAALADLTPAHRTSLQSIVDGFDAGTIADPADAVRQIDALLTPDEAKAVLAEREKMMAQRRAAMGAPPPNAPPPGAPDRVAERTDAGRFLLMLTASPERMRDLRGDRDAKRAGR